MIYIRQSTEDNYLEHHGIKGQKWGIRRYQNYDGTLTNAGKKRIHEEYVKYQRAGDKNLADNHTKLYISAINKVAEEVNSNGGLAKYDKSQIDKMIEKCMYQRYDEFIKNDSNYQKAKNLVKKYNMLDWDNDAKTNSEALKHIRTTATST